MTGWNKLIGGTLALIIVAQFCHGVYALVWMFSHTSKSHNDLIVCVQTNRFLSGTDPDRPGYIQVLHLQTMEDWGTHLLQSDDFLWYVLTLLPAALFRPAALTRIFPVSLYHRSSCVLGHSGHSKEIRED